MKTESAWNNTALMFHCICHCIPHSHEGLCQSASLELHQVHKGPVTWLDMDPIEGRYLLSGSADASIAVYDTFQNPELLKFEEDKETPFQSAVIIRVSFVTVSLEGD